MMVVAAATLSAQGVKPLPTLQVEGRWLTDQHGNHVVLHGVMDTPNMYFNGWRWGSPWTGTNYDSNGATKCKNYFEKILTGLEQAKCNVFRLHLDPAWTNDPSPAYTYSGSVGQPADAVNEADIKKFNPNRLKSFLNTLYFPLMQKAMNHGMYVVVRPPGVCPSSLKVGDYYQQYLMTVWDIVSQNANIKKYAGQISIELANEPVSLKNADGQEDARALHDYFQPIVDKIRSNGFTGIIWVPGTGWQANYTSYASHPIEGYNIGYAVHDYCGWYGCSDDTPSPANKIQQFHNQVPVVDVAPIIITEVDWSPVNPDAEGHYNEHGDWVQPNYGTWATGSTSKWGKAYKQMLDHYGNISMTLSGTSCLIDVDTLLNKNKVVPAFKGLAEACGKACMDWYADYYLVDWPHADDEPQSEESLIVESLAPAASCVEVMVGNGMVVPLIATFQDGHTREVTARATYETDAAEVVSVINGRLVGKKEGAAQIKATYTDTKGNQVTTTFNVRSTFFPFGKQYINTSFFAQGTYTESTRTFKPGQWGQMGWGYSDGADMSAYKYLVIKLKQAQNCDAHLNIFTENSIWTDGFESAAFGTKKQIVVNLSTAKTKNGVALNTKHIHIVAFWANGNGTIVVDDMYLTNNSDFSPEQTSGISQPAAAMRQSHNIYTLSGLLVGRADSQSAALSHLPAGIYIMNDKKLVIR